MSLPNTMRVVMASGPGGPEVLSVASAPVPSPGPGEVLIQVAAAGVNRPDVLQRQGLYPPPKGASAILGLEVAGRVAAVGPNAGEWKVGDPLCALVNSGGYADYVLAPAPQCLPVPAGLSMIEAASLPETFFTVWTNVWDRAAIQPGETLLVQGGSSGIGVTAIQLAHAMGHRVFATAGSEDKCAACVKLGAERAINYKTEDFVEILKAETGGKGVNVILDMVGGEYTPRELKSLADDGRLVLIAFLGGAKATVNVADIMLRRLTLTGSTLRPRNVEFKGTIAARLAERVWPLLAAGKIRPVIHATFPLEEVADAHALMESGQHIGKIVLTVAEG